MRENGKTCKYLTERYLKKFFSLLLCGGEISASGMFFFFCKGS